MLDQELLKILACPETKEDLAVADDALVSKLNQLVEKGELVNQGGQKVEKKLETGLVRKSDQKVLYPVRDGIPVMLIDEGINLQGIA